MPKDCIKRVKRKSRLGNINNISNKEFLSAVYLDDFYKSVGRGRDDQMEKMGIKHKYFTKEVPTWPVEHGKRFHFISHQTEAILSTM